jgi:hypothetical protein
MFVKCYDVWLAPGVKIFKRFENFKRFDRIGQPEKHSLVGNMMYVSYYKLVGYIHNYTFYTLYEEQNLCSPTITSDILR